MRFLRVAADVVFGDNRGRRSTTRLDAFIQCGKHLIRLHGLLQCRRLGIVAVSDVGQITPQLFEQVDELGSLLLRQQCRLQFQVRPLFLEPGEPGLLAQNHGRGQQRAQRDQSLQPVIGRRIEFGHARQSQGAVGEYPEGNHEQNDRKKDRLPEKADDAFQQTLRTAYLLLVTRVEVQNSFDVLADLVAFGISVSVTWMRGRRSRNASFRFHPGVRLLKGSARPPSSAGRRACLKATQTLFYRFQFTDHVDGLIDPEMDLGVLGVWRYQVIDTQGIDLDQALAVVRLKGDESDAHGFSFGKWLPIRDGSNPSLNLIWIRTSVLFANEPTRRG